MTADDGVAFVFLGTLFREPVLGTEGSSVYKNVYTYIYIYITLFREPVLGTEGSSVYT
jgi:hypothetical protein